MIVPIQHVDVICPLAEKEATLSALRDLKAVHLDLASGVSPEVQTLRGEASRALTAVSLIRRARQEVEIDDATQWNKATVQDVLAWDAEIAALKDRMGTLAGLIQKYAPYGDFDPELVKKIRAAGVDLSQVAELPEVLPPKRLSALQAEKAQAEARKAELTAQIAQADEKPILTAFPELEDRIAFAEARRLMSAHGELAVISGWIPEPRVAALRDAAKVSGWGLLLRKPAEDELPPTLLEPPKAFKPLVAIFKALGISPAYNEADVSVPFMCYFSLFFAMLVGDGAYGLIFLALTLLGWKKTAGHRSPVAKSWLVLMTVFSSATVVWGLLSNTWFGAGLPCCKNWVTVQWLADPSYRHMMLLCFTIGVSHLMIARIWNGICLINDTKCLAEFGWAGILLYMYFVTNTIVGIFPGVPMPLHIVMGVSVLLVACFSLKKNELKTRGAELGMLPLTIISSLGDIISYVRLFAVGLASVKVAENFNSMALSFMAGEHAWYVTALAAVGMVLVLLVGHGMNIAMAALSVLVHAVRLNTLEFSNHKGVSWSGYFYSPFQKRAGNNC